MWRNSSAASKCSGKVADGKPALAGNLFKRKLFFKIGVDRISRKPQLPRCQPSAHQGSRKMHAAIYKCEMYIQRGRDPMNKSVVDAVMPIDRQYQTVPKVQSNGIIGHNTGPYSKLHDSIGAVIVSKLIESSSRNEKVKAVGLVFGTGRRIKSQADEANRAIWKGNIWRPGFSGSRAPKTFLCKARTPPLEMTDRPKSVYQDEVCRSARRRARFFEASG